MEGTRVTIPETVALDRSSPLNCLKSMGLYVSGEHAEPRIKDIDETKIMSTIWTAFGGVDIFMLDEPLVVRYVGNYKFITAEGPREIAECKLSTCTLFVCKIRLIKAENVTLHAKSMISIDHTNHIADVCVYDPKWTYSTTLCYAGESIKGWLRAALGPGWGVRVETLTEREVPRDIMYSFYDTEERKLLCKLWIFMICLLKTYFPHMQGIDIATSIVLDSSKDSIGVVAVLLDVFHNMEELTRGNWNKKNLTHVHTH